jgi:hypothetical protein
MAKFSAGLLMVIEWTPTGGTTFSTIGAQGRDLSLNASVDDADASGYGDANHVYVVTLADAELSFEVVLDDTSLTVEDLFIPGARGTLVYYPAGKVPLKRRVTFPGFVSQANDDYPYTDVAVRAVTMKPTGTILRATVP